MSVCVLQVHDKPQMLHISGLISLVVITHTCILCLYTIDFARVVFLMSFRKSELQSVSKAPNNPRLYPEVPNVLQCRGGQSLKLRIRFKEFWKVQGRPGTKEHEI